MPTFGVSRAFTPLFTPHPQVAMSPLAGRQMAFVMYAERLQQNEDEQCARQTATETKEAASCNNMGTVSEDTYLMFLDSYLHRTLAKLGIMVAVQMPAQGVLHCARYFHDDLSFFELFTCAHRA